MSNNFVFWDSDSAAGSGSTWTTIDISDSVPVWMSETTVWRQNDEERINRNRQDFSHREVFEANPPDWWTGGTRETDIRQWTRRMVEQEMGFREFRMTNDGYCIFDKKNKKLLERTTELVHKLIRERWEV